MSQLRIDEMTVEEKLQAMEALWDDLCARAERVPSPDWHRAVLEEREAAVGRGQEILEDWAAAKKRILDDTR